MSYQSKYKQGYSRYWLTKWMSNWKHIKRILHTNTLCFIKFSVKSYIFKVWAKIWTKLYKWLTERVSDKLKTHQTWIYLRYKCSVFYKIFCEKLISRGISLNMIKVIPMTDWLSEGQTENAINVNIYIKETFFYTRIMFHNRYCGCYKAIKIVSLSVS